MVLGQMGKMTIGGIVIGVPLARALSRFIESFLYGVKPGDIVTISIAVGTLVLFGVAGSLIPALRAASVQPVTTLRHE